MKKILMVIHTPPPYGGGEVQALNLKKYFKNKNNYFIYDYSNKDKSRSDWGQLKLKVLLKGIKWIFKVIYLIIRINPDVIYFTLPKSFPAFMRNASVIPIAKLWKVKIKGELPGTTFPFIEKKNTYKNNIGCFVLKSIDEIRFLSPSIKQYHIKKHGLNNSTVILNGITVPENYRAHEKIFYKSPFSLIYIGSLEFSKGLFNSIQAIKLCNNNNLDLHLNLIGEWCYQNEKHTINKYINQHNLKDSITFHGTLTGKEKWEVFSNSAILVHPTYWDGVPLTILEALGIGLPVISTKVGGIPDTISHLENGFILENNTPSCLFKAIDYLYKNRQELSKFSKNNLKLYKEKYHISKFLTNMEEWFQS